MRWSEIRVLYTRELRSALRERSIVVSSLLLPVLVYPVILWLVFTGITFVQGQSERATSRIAVFEVPASHEELVDSLAALRSVELNAEISTPDAAVTAVRAGELDAAVFFEPAEGAAAALADNFRVRVVYDRAEDRSRRAVSRIASVVGEFRERWTDREAAALGIVPEALEPFGIARENISTDDELAGMLLGFMVPTFLIIMVGLGCFYPAIDATAGERERSTWETLMTVSASRSSVLIAKYLYVATMGIAAGLLNVTAMTASLGVLLAPLAGGEVLLTFRLPLAAVPVLFVGAAGLALFFAAAMMILASFARTFKDGQAMVTPVYYLALMPIFMGQSFDRRLTFELALIPIVNVTQMMRDALLGAISWPLTVLSMAVLLTLVALCLVVARQILRFEDHMLGTYDGSFWRFVRERLLPGRRTARFGGNA